MIMNFVNNKTKMTIYLNRLSFNTVKNKIHRLPIK